MVTFHGIGSGRPEKPPERPDRLGYIEKLMILIDEKDQLIDGLNEAIKQKERRITELEANLWEAEQDRG